MAIVLKPSRASVEAPGPPQVVQPPKDGRGGFRPSGGRGLGMRFSDCGIETGLRP